MLNNFVDKKEDPSMFERPANNKWMIDYKK